MYGFWLFALALSSGKVIFADDYLKCGTDNFSRYINGINGLVKTSDPIMIEFYTGDETGLTYELKDAKFVGLSNCKVDRLSIDPKNTAFQYYLDCPYLEENATYNLKGTGLTTPGGENGKLKYIFNDSLIMLQGTYKKYTSDGVEHITVSSYEIDVKNKGKVEIDLRNMLGSEDENLNAVRKLMQENWKLSGVKPFVDEFVKNLNGFLKHVSITSACVH